MLFITAYPANIVEIFGDKTNGEGSRGIPNFIFAIIEIWGEAY